VKNNIEILDDFEMVFFDEVHCIADPGTQRYQSLKFDKFSIKHNGRTVFGPSERGEAMQYMSKLEFTNKLEHLLVRHEAKLNSKEYIRILSGYPVENLLQEIYVVSLISDVLGTCYPHFLNKYFHVIKKNNRIVRITPKHGSFEEIIRLIKPFTFLVDKSVVMPSNVKKESIITRFELSDEQRQIIDSLRLTGKCKVDGHTIRCKNSLVVYQKVMQIISGFIYCTDDQSEIFPIPLKSNPKLQLLDHLIADKSNFLLWHFYDFERELLQKYEGQCRMCKLQTDSRGLNLQDYKFSIYYTLPLSGGQYLQSQDRLYRIGRTTDVLSVTLLPSGEFGDRLSKMINGKVTLTDKFIKSLLSCKL
jgi:hypothetical protein